MLAVKLKKEMSRFKYQTEHKLKGYFFLDVIALKTLFVHLVLGGFGGFFVNFWD